ncbi:hypothetical protein K2173_015362 [Erythroxylum novogranatense]|uniref:Uncharacterized protein n=1 Tax=Erythroxylum novogranatense TaxID=1862640 RepID=A0AAV8SS51_9ROSI|nr:hypothetical protein K2173_015362 [Erythroxylum novogranatense]
MSITWVKTLVAWTRLEVGWIGWDRDRRFIRITVSFWYPFKGLNCLCLRSSLCLFVEDSKFLGLHCLWNS